MTANAATDPNLIHLQRVVKLTAVLHQAKRVVPTVRRFSNDPATPHEVFHEHLDALVGEIVGH